MVFSNEKPLMQSMACVHPLHTSLPREKRVNNFYSSERAITHCILKRLYAYRFHLKQEGNCFLKAAYDMNFASLLSL